MIKVFFVSFVLAVSTLSAIIDIPHPNDCEWACVPDPPSTPPGPSVPSCALIPPYCQF